MRPSFSGLILLCFLYKCLLLAGFKSNWYPICVVNQMPKEFPQQIKVLGRNFVVWFNPETGKWNVMNDFCSHRNAPLSEGRINKDSNCIECAYHGWTFNDEGECMKIPQLELDIDFQDKILNQNGKTSVKSYDTKLCGQILFALIESCKSPDDQEKNDSKHISEHPVTLPTLTEPEKVLDGLLYNVSSVSVRDLPYSWDYLLENFMDPAHIPFAHHGLQGTRDDAVPIPMNILTSLNKDANKLEISFKDKVGNKERDGVVSFIPPVYYHYRTKKGLGLSDLINLLILCVPVSPGRSRAFVALLPGRKLPFRIPMWLSHALTNRFLDTDIWVHDQERISRGLVNDYLSKDEMKPTKYFLPSSSDTGCVLWRKWYERHLSSIVEFRPSRVNELKELSFEEKFDRRQHIKHCVSCSGALENMRLIKQKVVPLVLGSLGIVYRSTIARLCFLLTYILVNTILSKMIAFVQGPKLGDKTSAAQLSP